MAEQTCDRPPAGWHCTRDAGHGGPCAAIPVASGLPECDMCEQRKPDAISVPTGDGDSTVLCVYCRLTARDEEVKELRQALAVQKADNYAAALALALGRPDLAREYLDPTQPRDQERDRG